MTMIIHMYNIYYMPDNTLVECSIVGHVLSPGVCGVFNASNECEKVSMDRRAVAGFVHID